LKSNQIISRNDVFLVIGAALRNWYVLILIPILFFSVAYVVTHRIQDVYASNCQILLRAQETYDYQSQISRGLGLNSRYGGYEYTAGQMKIIKSTTILDEVIDSLDLNVSYYIVGRLKVTELFQHVPFEVTFNKHSKQVYNHRFNLTIQDENSYRLLYEIEGVSKDKTFQFDELVVDDGLYLKVAKATAISKKNIDNYREAKYQFEITSDNRLINELKSAISVSNLDYTSIIEVTLKDEIPDRAVAVLDRIAKSYIQTTVQSQTDINQNTLRYIDKQLNEVTGIINTIEDELEKYKEDREILSLSREEESQFEMLGDLELEEREKKLQLQSLSDLREYLLENDNVENLQPPSLFLINTDGQIAIKVKDLFDLRSSYISLQEAGTIVNPKIESVAKQIDVLKMDILKYIDNQELAIKNNLKDFNRRRGDIEQKIKQIPKSQREILNIQRRLDVNEQLYNFLLSRRAETIIARAGLLPETKLIERPRSVGVVYPDKQKMNLTWLLIGVALALAFVVVKEIFFRKIQNVQELSAITDIAILGGVPEKKNLPLNFRLDQFTQKSDVIQAFRSLRTTLQYLEKSNKCQKVLVTSLLPGEGKTFISTNIASILALAEKKVLIIDFDMHKPRLAKAMELPNDKGLSTYLSGSSTVSEVIQNTHLDNLFAITSGPIPPNPSELILRTELKELYVKCEEEFDYIILDTPPISLITDGITLMKDVDMRLFVLNSQSTSRGGIGFIEKLLDDNRLDGSALIMNREKQAMLAKYYGSYNYSGYYYQYSDKYGY
jgi:capsular exopolysaccharide synthesis family protein